jgi:hypothetical protein
MPAITDGTIQPSGDSSGMTDAAAVHRLASLPGRTVALGPGTFHLGGVSLAPGTTVRGAGPGATIVTVPPGFAGSSMFSLHSDGYACVCDMSIVGARSAITSNPASDAIALNGGRYCRIDNVFFQYINGWCVNSVGTANRAGYATMLTRLSGLNNAGGVHVQGVPGRNWGAQHFLANLNFQQTGVATGPAANRDCVLLEDVYDITGTNFNLSVSHVSTGSAVHIKGRCATVYLEGMDCGTYPNGAGINYVWLIEDSANGSPADISVVNAVGQQGYYGLRITGAARGLDFVRFNATNNLRHGISVEGTGTNINFTGLRCSWNGQDKNGDSHDINWSSVKSTGTLRNVTLNSPLASPGTAGVANPASFVPGNKAIAEQWVCSGRSTTANNVFPAGAQAPSIVRNVHPWNPRGGQNVAVPASGTPAGRSASDRWYYITAAASGTSVTVTGANPMTLDIPVGGTVPVFVPAGQSITPVYRIAPDWTVYGT